MAAGLERYFLIFIGGGIGSVLRYLMIGLIQGGMTSVFPLGTMAVNIAGSLAIGLTMSLSERFVAIAPEIRIFLTVGIMGGFTTFSTFSYETLMMLKDGELFYGAMNIAGTVTACVTAAWLGMLIGRTV